MKVGPQKRLIPNILREKARDRKYYRPIWRGNIDGVRKLDLSAEELVSGLLGLSRHEQVAILDSCGVGHLGSHLLIAGIMPTKISELTFVDPTSSLEILSEALTVDLAAVFTLSYEFGMKLQRIPVRHSTTEPDVFLALYNALVVHDYDSNETCLLGNHEKFDEIETLLSSAVFEPNKTARASAIRSNLTSDDYRTGIETIKERIRLGDTYQTNLTRKITAELDGLDPATVFSRIRSLHPAPFASFIKREDSTVVSASPERFFRLEGDRIWSSPIKGTRPRGLTPERDFELRLELASSEKDRAENIMIVDLLRNDLGRVCEFGTIGVEKLCEIEDHRSLYHLVSTISGTLKPGIRFSDVLRSLFPCGSITGAPKVSTMRIIDEIEPLPRGLSMGAIGMRLPAGFGLGEIIDTSVAIRTMVIRGNVAEFNVGGGIVIDSDPNSEYLETVTKSRALLEALGVDASELLWTAGV